MGSPEPTLRLSGAPRILTLQHMSQQRGWCANAAGQIAALSHADAIATSRLVIAAFVDRAKQPHLNSTDHCRMCKTNIKVY